MRGLSAHTDLQSRYGVLEATAERAGRSLACAFSSADEYEAALISERRAAGAYRKTTHPAALIAAAVAGAVITLVIVIL